MNFLIFDYEERTVRSDAQQQLDLFQKNWSFAILKISAFCVMDAPYIHNFSVTVLQDGISLVNKKFPGIPTYIVFAQHCFDPSFPCPGTSLPPVLRGIPKNLDWVGFAWFITSNDIEAEFYEHIVGGVEKLARLTNKKLMLVPEAMNQYQLPTTVLQIQNFHFALAQTFRNIIGLDFFLWASNPPFYSGARNLPLLKKECECFWI